MQMRLVLVITGIIWIKAQTGAKEAQTFNGSATSLSYEPRIRRLRHWGVKGWKLHFQDPIGAIFFIDVCVNI